MAKLTLLEFIAMANCLGAFAVLSGIGFGYIEPIAGLVYAGQAAMIAFIVIMAQNDIRSEE